MEDRRQHIKQRVGNIATLCGGSHRRLGGFRLQRRGAKQGFDLAPYSQPMHLEDKGPDEFVSRSWLYVKDVGRGRVGGNGNNIFHWRLGWVCVVAT